MKILNRVVLIGLLGSGLLLLIGVFLGRGNLTALATYVGWFFAAFSAVAYFVTSIRMLLIPITEFWRDLYTINFGLTLLGISAFGFSGQEEVVVVAGCFLFAIVLALLFNRLNGKFDKFIPISSIALLAIPATSWLRPFWIYVYLAIGASLTVLSILKLFAMRKREV